MNGYNLQFGRRRTILDYRLDSWLARLKRLLRVDEENCKDSFCYGSFRLRPPMYRVFIAKRREFACHVTAFCGNMFDIKYTDCMSVLYSIPPEYTVYCLYIPSILPVHTVYCRFMHYTASIQYTAYILILITNTLCLLELAKHIRITVR